LQAFFLFNLRNEIPNISPIHSINFPACPVVEDTGSLTKIGTGTFVLAGANTYTAGTFVGTKQ